MSLEIGKIYDSNNFGKYEILERLDNNHFKIRFFDTGTIQIVGYEAMRHGRVRDKFAPNVAGVGYTGTFNGVVSNPINRPIYAAWNDMLNRCYNPTDRDYPLYGGIGITVDHTWFDFGIFFEDVKTIPFYNKKIIYPDIYQLDKDYLQRNIPKSQRVYSKYTCIWLSKYDNSMMMNKDYGSKSGYIGVVCGDGEYTVRINNRYYSTYDDPIAAANASNNLYNMRKINNPHMNIPILNEVPYMSYDEMIKHQLHPKIMYKDVEKC